MKKMPALNLFFLHLVYLSFDSIGQQQQILLGLPAEKYCLDQLRLKGNILAWLAQKSSKHFSQNWDLG